MSYAQRLDVTLTTLADGTVTGFIDVQYGRVHTMIYTKDTFANGVDFTITAEATGEGIWTESDVNASKTIAPRQPIHDKVAVASLYADNGQPVEDYIVLAKDRIKIVIAAGGNVKKGKFTAVIT